MPLFELDETGSRLVQPMQPAPAAFPLDSSALVGEHIASLLGENLLPVAFRRDADDDAPHLLALDVVGQPVVVEVVQVLDSEALIRSLNFAGRAGRLTSSDIARLYHAGTEQFQVDLVAFRESLPAAYSRRGLRVGARLLLVCADVGEDVVDAVDYLRAPGRQVEVLQMGVIYGEDGRRFIDVSPLVGPITEPRPVESPLRLQRSQEAYAAAVAYDVNRASKQNGSSVPREIESAASALSAISTSSAESAASPPSAHEAATSAASPPFGVDEPVVSPTLPLTPYTPRTPRSSATPPSSPTPPTSGAPVLVGPHQPLSTPPEPSGPPPSLDAVGAPGVVEMPVVAESAEAPFVVPALDPAPLPPPPPPPARGTPTTAPSPPAEIGEPEVLVPAQAAPLLRVGVLARVQERFEPAPRQDAYVLPSGTGVPPVFSIQEAPPGIVLLAQAAERGSFVTGTEPQQIAADGPVAEASPLAVPAAPALPAGLPASPPPAPLSPPPAPLSSLVTLANRLGSETELVWLRLRRGERLTAVLRTDGLIELPDGSLHASPDAAAATATGGARSADGWQVWHVGEDGPPLAQA